MNNREDWDIRIAEMSCKHPEAHLPELQDDAAEELRSLQSFDLQDEFAGMLWYVIVLSVALIFVSIVV